MLQFALLKFIFHSCFFPIPLWGIFHAVMASYVFSPKSFKSCFFPPPRGGGGGLKRKIYIPESINQYKPENNNQTDLTTSCWVQCLVMARSQRQPACFRLGWVDWVRVPVNWSTNHCKSSLLSSLST